MELLIEFPLLRMQYLSVLDGELEEELDEEELDDEDRPDICFPAVASLSPVAHAVAG